MSLASDIAKRMLGSRKPLASVKAAPQPGKVAPKRPEPAQAVLESSGKTGSAVEQPRAKSAKQADYSEIVIIDQGPRVVSSPPRHRSAPYNPPRREEPDIAALVEAFTPPPVTPPLPPPVISGTWKGSCKAVDAITGRTCKLPSHPQHPDQHRHERGMFHRVAAPGTTSFPLRQALDAAALAQAPIDGPAATESSALAKRNSRDRLRAGIRLRAHAGDDTSTGLKSIDSPAANPTHDTEAA